MEGYASEHEQIEAIRKWWKENGKSVITGLIIGLAALFGGKYWVDYKNTRAEGASVVYDQMMDGIKKNDMTAVIDRGEYIIGNFPKSTYAAVAALAVAKAKVEEGDLATARLRLQWVVSNAVQAEFVHIARVRLAKVMLAQGEGAQALTLLNGIDTGNFSSSYEAVKGDIYASLGQLDNARDAYKKAVATLPEGVDRQQLQMKLDDLGADE